MEIQLGTMEREDGCGWNGESTNVCEGVLFLLYTDDIDFSQNWWYEFRRVDIQQQ
jgi:hypothetical protein